MSEQPTMKEWREEASNTVGNVLSSNALAHELIADALKVAYERGVRDERARNPLGHSTDCICVRCEDANRAAQERK